MKAKEVLYLALYYCPQKKRWERILSSIGWSTLRYAQGSAHYYRTVYKRKTRILKRTVLTTIHKEYK